MEACHFPSLGAFLVFGWYFVWYLQLRAQAHSPAALAGSAPEASPVGSHLCPLSAKRKDIDGSSRPSVGQQSPEVLQGDSRETSSSSSSVPGFFQQGACQRPEVGGRRSLLLSGHRGAPAAY